MSFGSQFGNAGLPIASVVRPTKIAAIDAARAAILGQAPPAVLADVSARIGATLGFAVPP